MIWDSPALVGFARRAGWQGADLIEATARALVASGGDDAMVTGSLFPEGTSWVGLWQLPVPGLDPGQVDPLLHPDGNAAEAYLSWVDAGRAWPWLASQSPVSLLRARENAFEASRARVLSQAAGSAPDYRRLEARAARVARESRYTGTQLAGFARALRDRAK